MKIKLSDYDYYLPEENIAKHPLENREDSRLLLYQQQHIKHHSFNEIAHLLPSDAMLVFNDTKVISARIFFYKDTGALIEIFILNPLNPAPVHITMQEKRSCTWSCMIGNLKKWKDKDILKREVEVNGKTVILNAELKNRGAGEVVFSWDDSQTTFAEILESAGEVPLPPYLNRKATQEDKPRYQTVYSKNQGAVAAPTAGLHFTNDVLKELENKGIRKEYLTLHVSAGTFQPVKHENVVDHPMHSEVVIIKKETIRSLLNFNGKIIAVGTTSMRSLESLYWFGVKLHLNKGSLFKIDKLDPYQIPPIPLPSKTEAFEEISNYMVTNDLNQLYGSTEIFIMPGYQFKICDGLITNFHLPKSTLILLIAAFVGENWRKIYQEALNENYRFLSYGDSSFLMP
ncbi:MAG: S-adenosylmethionine:tRNA ribosyltransferase-isomerase [Bacteroidota bacterium]|nr:S-adenosylmethionine:tRNA ribosyltransferase-isomerase [Bacteroidota bacterium]